MAGPGMLDRGPVDERTDDQPEEAGTSDNTAFVATPRGKRSDNHPAQQRIGMDARRQ
jgi:hypothetical protein